MTRLRRGIPDFSDRTRHWRMMHGRENLRTKRGGDLGIPCYARLAIDSREVIAPRWCRLFALASRSRPIIVISCRVQPSIGCLIRWLLPAVVLACGLGWHVKAVASTVSPAGISEEHAHYCKCPRCRGATCCCKPDHPAASPAAIPPPAPARSNDGPCLNSDPCGDPGLPPSATAGASAGAASFDRGGCLMRVDSGRLVIRSPRCVRPARRAFRLDDPPEHSALG